MKIKTVIFGMAVMIDNKLYSRINTSDGFEIELLDGYITISNSKSDNCTLVFITNISCMIVIKEKEVGTKNKRQVKDKIDGV